MPTTRNKFGKHFSPGKAKSLAEKEEVADWYWCLYSEKGKPPSYNSLSKHARVSRKFARKVALEIEHSGNVVDPDVLKEHQLAQREIQFKITPEESLFLLALRSEDPSLRNIDEVEDLHTNLDKLIYLFHYNLQIRPLFFCFLFCFLFHFRFSCYIDRTRIIFHHYHHHLPPPFRFRLFLDF